MASPEPRLDSLRQDVDDIDSALHDLIVKRGAIVEDIRKIKKQAGPALRPGREAIILRRLAAKHHGAFPLQALISLWREMMGGFTHMQQPFSCAAYAPAGHDRMIGLARDHYGSLTPISAMPSGLACVRAVADGGADVGILPVPADGDTEPWWPLLMGSDKRTPKVVSRLPFVGGGDGDEALVIAPWARDYSDSETSLVAIRLGERASRGRVMNVMAAVGFRDAVSMAATETSPNDCSHIFEVEGAFDADDPAVAALGVRFGAAFIDARVVGGYAHPLALSSNTGKN